MSFFRNFDWGILFASIALSCIGLLMQESVAPVLFFSQLIFVIVGLILFLLFSLTDINIYSSLKNIFYFLIFAGLMLTFFIGEEVRGSVRWITVGGMNLQISEFAKPFFIIILSIIFGSEGNKKKKLLKGFLLSIPIILLIFKQPDLGNTIVYLMIFVGIAVASGYLPIIFITSLLLSIFTPFFWHFLHDYQRQRIITFLNPAIDPQGAGYNALQATIAVGSGGLFGKGLGQGTQSHLNFLPEHHTDFIFASFTEEFGFVGGVVLIALYTFLLVRIIATARKCESKESSLIAIGIFSMIFIQVFINIGMNIGLLPITGITLPLLSYGGSSIITTFISLGIIESLQKKSDEIKVMKIK